MPTVAFNSSSKFSRAAAGNGMAQARPGNAAHGRMRPRGGGTRGQVRPMVAGAVTQRRGGEWARGSRAPVWLREGEGDDRGEQQGSSGNAHARERQQASVHALEAEGATRCG